MNNLIKTLVIGIVFKKQNLTPQNENYLVLLSKQKTTTWSAINRPEKNLEYKQSVVDQQQQ